MSGKKGLILLTVLALALAPLGGAAGSAGNQALPAPENVAVVLVVDVSASMRETDPQGLRETAARVFVDLLGPDDYFSAIVFSDEAEVLFPLQQVKDSRNKEHFKEVLSSKLTPRGYTDFNAALEEAFRQLRDGKTEGARPAVVFLTDGEPDPGPGLRRNKAYMEGYMEALWKLVADFALHRYPVYTVGFSEEIDPGLISKISLDTLGESYRLQDPGELMVTFFTLLGKLKNRNLLLEERGITGAERSFTFRVDDYIRQVNLVVAGKAGSFKAALYTPRGEEARPGEIKGLSAIEEEGSTLIVLHQPEAALFGDWRFTVSGGGPVDVMADSDLFLKAWLKQPLPSSQHPLHEPLEFEVEVTRGGALKDLPFKVELLLTKPGRSSPEVIPLAKGEKGIFRGSYQQVDAMGAYQLLVRLLLEGKVISTSAATVYVKLLPALSTDFRPGDDFRLGEEVIVSASLELAGQRIAQGRELKVDNFQMVMNYEDGSRVFLPLHDSGNFEEHGNVKAQDGIWSNRLVFGREGAFEAFIQVRGEFRGTEFFLEKRLGFFRAFPPGNIKLTLVPGNRYFALKGGRISYPVAVENNSSFREELYLNGSSSEIGTLRQAKLTLEPGETGTFTLELDLSDSLEAGSYIMPLYLASENALTTIEPSLLELPVEIVTRGEYARRWLELRGRLLAAAGGIGPLLAAFFYAGGLILYRVYVLPQNKVEGSLIYWKAADQEESVIASKKLPLWKLGKDKVLIAFHEDQKADFHLEGADYRHNYHFTIKSYLNLKGPRFLQGWKGLFQRQVPVSFVLQCSEPGVIEFEGALYTGKELFHEDTFKSGGFVFRYINYYSTRWFRGKGEGVNILAGKVLEE